MTLKHESRGWMRFYWAGMIETAVYVLTIVGVAYALLH